MLTNVRSEVRNLPNIAVNIFSRFITQTITCTILETKKSDVRYEFLGRSEKYVHIARICSCECALCQTKKLSTYAGRKT